MNRVFMFFSFLSSLILLLSATTLAQTPPAQFGADQKPAIGSYREFNLVLEVKVQGGSIRLYNGWENGKWEINPQHAQLTFSTQNGGVAYGHNIPFQIARGPRVWEISGQSNAYILKPEDLANSGVAGSSTVPDSVTALISSQNIHFCGTEGSSEYEIIVVNSAGFRWVDRRQGRKWAQYDFNGVLQEWGFGNFREGQQLFDNNGKSRGYADTFGSQVITFTRNAAGQIETISDYSGRTLQYTYTTNDRIEDFTDADGIVTHYQYQGGIVQKRVGNNTNSAPGEEANDQTIISLGYGDEGGLFQVSDQDGITTSYQYLYDSTKKLFTTTSNSTGNISTEIVKTLQEGLRSISRNGQYQARIYQICEDTAYIDRHNRLYYFDRDSYHNLKQLILPDNRKYTLEYLGTSWQECGVVYGGLAGLTDPWGLVALTLPSGTRIDFTRNNFGEATHATATTSLNEVRHWNFLYDAYGNVTEQRFQAGPTQDNTKDSVELFTYDTYGNISSWRSPNTAAWNYLHNARGDFTQVTAPSSQVWSFTYDSQGNLKHYLDPSGYEQTLNYSKRELLEEFREKHTASTPEAVTKFLYNHRGLVRRVIDPFNNQWNYEYTEQGDLHIATDPAGKHTIYDYDPIGRLTSYTDNNGVNITVNYFDTAPQGFAPQTSFAFTPLIHINYPTFKRELHYNLRDELVLDRLVPNGPVVTNINQLYQYDLDGRLSQVTRPDGQISSYTYDVLNRVKSITEPGKGTTNIDYPEGLRKILYHDPLGGTVEQRFNELGQMIKEIRADLSELNYTYNANSNLASFINSRGQVTQLNYDASQNVNQIDYLPTAAATPSRSVTLARNLRGDLTSYNDNLPGASTSEAYTRDAWGRITATNLNYGAFSKGYANTYTNNALPSTYTIDGTVYTYSWDPANQFQGIQFGSSGNLNFLYDQTNWFQPTTIQFPGGAREEFTYDNLRRLKHIHSKTVTNTQIMDFDYSYQNNSLFNPLITGIATDHGNYSYGYDTGNRLTSATYPDSSTEGFSYDSLSRRQPASGMPWNYNANGAVLSTGTLGYTYDSDGNRATETDATGTAVYTYDESNRLTKIEKPAGTVVASYHYDPFGRRLWKDVGGVRTYFYYSQDGLAAEIDSTGNTQKKYFYVPGSEWSTAPLAVQEGSNYYFYHTDHIGTPRVATDINGQKVWDSRYKAFGETTTIAPANPALAITSNLRFPGQYFDAETGLHHNFHRNYDPKLGAYQEQDPYGMLAGLNRYHYAMGNPVTFFDPRGEFTDAEKAAIAAAAAAGAIYFTPIGAEIGAGLGGAAGAALFTPVLPGVGTAAGAVGGVAVGAVGGAAVGAIGGAIVGGAVGVGAVVIAQGIANISIASSASMCSGGGDGGGNEANIKTGSAGGPTEGKRFPKSVKNAAKAENPKSTCVFCKREGTGTQVDHAIARSKGGNATLNNAQLACPHCNASKGAGTAPKSPPPGALGPRRF